MGHFEWFSDKSAPCLQDFPQTTSLSARSGTPRKLEGSNPAENVCSETPLAS